MLQRSLPAVAQWVPALSSSGWCHLQQAAQQITGLSSGSSSGILISELQSLPVCQHVRLLHTVDVRQLPRRRKTPYFNPEDGPEAYNYWRDLWATRQKPPKPQKPHKLPVYLEPDEQQMLMAAAEKAGIPSQVLQGTKYKYHSDTPALIAAIEHSGGRIPTDPDKLHDRIQGLFDLQREVPGLDVMRILKSRGFSILEESPSQVKQNLAYISKSLAAAGVSAEPGLLLTAASKPALKYPVGLIDRVKQLPAVFGEALDAQVPPTLLTHPFKANVLNKTSLQVHKRLRTMAERYGKQQAAALYEREPQLLMFRNEVLRRKIQSLERALRLTSEEAYIMLHRQPRLLTYSAETLAAKIKGLRDLLKLTGDAGRQQLREILTARPALLNKKAKSIEKKLGVLAKELDISADTAAAIICRVPSLANFSVASLKKPMQAFEKITDSSALVALKPQAQEILKSEPALCLLIEDSEDARVSLAGRLLLLERVAAISSDWRSLIADWAGSSSSSDVAHVLLYSNYDEDMKAADRTPAVVERLEWILQQQQQQQQEQQQQSPRRGAAAGAKTSARAAATAAPSVAFDSLITMDDLAFERHAPGFLAHKQELQQARQAAAAAENGQQ